MNLFYFVIEFCIQLLWLYVISFVFLRLKKRRKKVNAIITGIGVILCWLTAAIFSKEDMLMLMWGVLIWWGIALGCLSCMLKNPRDCPIIVISFFGFAAVGTLYELTIALFFDIPMFDMRYYTEGFSTSILCSTLPFLLILLLYKRRQSKGSTEYSKRLQKNAGFLACILTITYSLFLFLLTLKGKPVLTLIIMMLYFLILIVIMIIYIWESQKREQYEAESRWYQKYAEQQKNIMNLY